MRRFIAWLAVGVAPVVLFSLVPARADEEENVPLDKVPKAVMDAFKARFKDAKPTSASKETEKEKVFYEISFKEKERNVDVTFTPDGELVAIEREIDAKDLPRAVSKTLDEKYPKAEFKVVEEVTKLGKQESKQTFYEVHLVTTEKQHWEVQIDPSGKILATEKKDPKKDK